MTAPGFQVPDVIFPNGEERPALGLGTWRMGEDSAHRAAEVGALRLALDIGYRVFDCAEMYGDGGAETVLGLALADALREGLPRESVCVVSKVLPGNAGAAGVLAACERSLRRLRLDSIDLYLLHWRGEVPLDETVDGFEQLLRRGWIRQWGVSNFDLGDLRELAGVAGGKGCATNQVCYSLSERGAEFDLLPWQQLHQMPLMAYSPIDQGALVEHAALRALAELHGTTPAQLALAWVMRQPGVMAIPKAAHAVHLRQNWDALSLRLDAAVLLQLDALFPPPLRRRPLAVR